MVSNIIHIYLITLYEVCGVDSVKNIVGRSVHHYNCVPIHAYIISSANIRPGIYMRTYHFLLHIPI